MLINSKNCQKNIATFAVVFLATASLVGCRRSDDTNQDAVNRGSQETIEEVELLNKEETFRSLAQYLARVTKEGLLPVGLSASESATLFLHQRWLNLLERISDGPMSGGANKSACRDFLNSIDACLGEDALPDWWESQLRNSTVINGNVRFTELQHSYTPDERKRTPVKKGFIRIETKEYGTIVGSNSAWSTPFILTSYDSNNKELWSTNVWVADPYWSEYAGGSYHFVSAYLHTVQLRGVNVETLIVAGVVSDTIYAEGFDPSSGKALFRFSSSYIRN